MTHTRYSRSQLSSLGQLTHSRRSDGAPEPDGALREAARKKIRHYRQLYINRPDPISFMPVAVDTSGRVYDDFSRLLFCTLTGKPQLCLMRYRKNGSNSVFFGRLVILVLKDQWG